MVANVICIFFVGEGLSLYPGIKHLWGSVLGGSGYLGVVAVMGVRVESESKVHVVVVGP